MSLYLAGRHISRDSPPPAPSRVPWEALQAEAHRPEIQQRIRRAIAAGVIRVLPDSDGGLRIVPIQHGPAGGPIRRRND